MSKYCVGVDFGSLSARALVADVADGRELAAATMDYPHAVMTEALPDGTRLPPDWALQHPQDYLDCLRFTVTEAVRRAGVSPEDVIGFGSDFDGIDEWPEGIGNPSDFPNLLELLRAHGYTQAQLEKLAGGNLWRVLKEADAARVC